MLQIRQLVGEPALFVVVDEGNCSDDFALLMFPSLLDHRVASQVPYGFRAVFVAFAADVSVKLLQQRIFHSDSEPNEFSHPFLPPCQAGFSQNQHGIAETVEAIPLPNSLFISGSQLVHAPTESSDQQQVGRFRQVEVGDEGIHRFELVTDSDEQLSPAFTGFNSVVIDCDSFQSPNGGRSDSDYFVPPLPSGVNFLGGFWWHSVKLFADLVLLD
jgi:hypothetical protein